MISCKFSRFYPYPRNLLLTIFDLSSCFWGFGPFRTFFATNINSWETRFRLKSLTESFLEHFGLWTSAFKTMDIRNPVVRFSEASCTTGSRSCDQRSHPITDTLIARILSKELFFGVGSPFDRDRRFRIFRSLTIGNRPLDLHLNVITDRMTRSLRSRSHHAIAIRCTKQRRSGEVLAPQASEEHPKCFALPE